MEAFRRVPSGGRVLFAFHPLPIQEREMITSDARFCRDHGLVLGSDPAIQGSRGQEEQDEELMLADVILCASTFTRSGILRRLAQLGRRGDVVIPGPIPYGAAPVAAALAPARHERVEFLFLGQGIQRKGLHHLLVAWRELAPRPAVARLTVVASAPDPAILGLADGVPGVRVLPRLPRPELDAVMAASDVLVLPSLVEGFGLVITEALGHGLHVIATTSTGLVDLDPDPLAGQVIAAGSLDELARSILRAVDPANRSRASAVQTAARWPWDRFRAGIVAGVQQA
jgi:glycosyltransferase involved in cell wall biosynthesis